MHARLIPTLLAVLATTAGCRETQSVTRPLSREATRRLPIAPGTYMVGCPSALTCEDNPRRSVTINAFSLDRMPSRWRDASACLAHRACRLPERASDTSRDEALIATYTEARDYCAARGGRLPTSDEWEIAARGGDERMYPWGNERRMDLVAEIIIRSLGPRKVTTSSVPEEIPGSESPFGVVGLVGGPAEWVSSEPGSPPIARGGTATADIGGIRLDSQDPLAFSAVKIHHLTFEARVGVRCAFAP